MNTFEIAVLSATAGFSFAAVLSLFGQGAAYRNGVTDGYGYAKEGRGHPGYRRAGEYLREHMKHRWHELTDSQHDA